MNDPHPFHSAVRGFVALAFALASLAGSASAATLTVTTTADSGPGSLRAQIAAAASGDFLVFVSGLSGQTITLTSGQLSVSQNLTIDGSALAIPVTISGNHTSRVFSIPSGASVTLSHLGIIDGAPGGGDGGGILSFGTLTLTACAVSGNSAYKGGAILNGGALILTACTLSGNSAYEGAYSAGGLHNFGTATLTACTLSGNSSHYSGGILNYGALTLAACTLSGNSAESGGGILNGGKATLSACTLSSNSATHGGGIYNTWGTLALSACTLSGNSATNYGGGIYSSSPDGDTLTLTACTVSGNSATYGAGGIFNQGLLTLGSTIIAGNSANSGQQKNLYHDSGVFASQGFNLSDDWGTLTPTATDLTRTVIALKLGTLADNGGPTQTHALLAGSAAIDSGDPTLLAGTDQRGASRPQGARADIGAFEYDVTTPTLLSISLTSNNAIPTRAKIGDRLTLAFTSSETIQSPTVTLAGHSATVTGSGTVWTATTTMTVGTPQGAATLSIAFADFAGHAGSPATATTDGSSVTIGSTTYTTWTAANFTAAELATPAISGEYADPDGAGITNLVRYALDLPARGPVAATTTAAFDGGTTPATLSLSFTIRAEADDLLYEVQSSQDLVTWELVAPYCANGTKRTELASVPVPAGATRFFLRLRVTQLP